MSVNEYLRTGVPGTGVLATEVESNSVKNNSHKDEDAVASLFF